MNPASATESGLLLQRLGRVNEAVTDFGRSIAIDPNPKRVRDAIARIPP
jgi:predicted RNA polymerase sigma factor